MFEAIFVNNFFISAPILGCDQLYLANVLRFDKKKSVGPQRNFRYKKIHKEKCSSFFGISEGLIFWQHIASFSRKL